MEQQTIADVPIGIFFSGGADSAILASLSRNMDLIFAEYENDDRAEIDRKFATDISQYLNANLQRVRIQGASADPEAILNLQFVAERIQKSLFQIIRFGLPIC